MSERRRHQFMFTHKSVPLTFERTCCTPYGENPIFPQVVKGLCTLAKIEAKMSVISRCHTAFLTCPDRFGRRNTDRIITILVTWPEQANVFAYKLRQCKWDITYEVPHWNTGCCLWGHLQVRGQSAERHLVNETSRRGHGGDVCHRSFRRYATSNSFWRKKNFFFSFFFPPHLTWEPAL